MTAQLNEFYRSLDRLGKRGVRPGLERMHKALALLGNPHLKYPVVHVAGTNGKGTSCHFLAQWLSASGYRTGLVLSPHVDDWRERIQISQLPHNGISPIPEDDLSDVHREVLDCLGGDHELTYFEWGVLLAFYYFARKQADCVVLETGMGGRWDATNVCHSFVAGVTTIGYDHMEYLGNSFEQILAEKLEIIKINSDFLFGLTEPRLVVQARIACENHQARFHHISDFLPHFSEIFHESPAAKRWPSYLRQNLCFSLALGRLAASRFKLVPEAKFLRSGVQCLPARFEAIHSEPLVILDGAHNSEGLLALKDHLMLNYPEGWDLVFGCLANRDFQALAEIVKSVHRNFWVRFDGGGHTTPDAVYEKVHSWLGGEVVSLNRAFKDLLCQENQDRPIIVCGSLYLCSQFRKWWKGVK